MFQIFPSEAFEVHEESWNAYPYCKTVLTNPGYMGQNFTAVIESIHLPDNGCSENPLNAPTKRDIIYLDICDDVAIGKYDYCSETDPKIFLSNRTGRGQLKPGWVHDTTPIMCCYKVVTVHFKWTGLSNFVEKTIQKQYPKIFTKFHREAFCWIDYWLDLTDDELREFEEKTSEQLLKQLAEPDKRGATLDDRPAVN
ncbi:phosphatidylinositol transfer protein [Oesophagostomum dentatum]|uniref:Phosphatidylinositol transfer protein n=1 Tax=Oesophagostomum dentatum TaxID=61180 RepID=A0A0B1S5P2_OESDE|nr:phosphatidylinositol transfer protein [Oesophagostomum dentatum]